MIHIAVPTQPDGSLGEMDQIEDLHRKAFCGQLADLPKEEVK